MGATIKCCVKEQAATLSRLCRIEMSQRLHAILAVHFFSSSSSSVNVCTSAQPMPAITISGRGNLKHRGIFASTQEVAGFKHRPWHHFRLQVADIDIEPPPSESQVDTPKSHYAGMLRRAHLPATVDIT